MLIPLLVLLMFQLVNEILCLLGDGLHRLLQILEHVGGIGLTVLDAALKAEDGVACEADSICRLLPTSFAQVIDGRFYV